MAKDNNDNKDQFDYLLPAVRDKNNPIGHYLWGANCDGYTMVDEKDLSVKLERMPVGTEEKPHYHQHAQQFFFILKGTAAFDIDGKTIMVHSMQGIHVRPKEAHRIMNGSDEELEFLLSSQPSTQNDRYNIV